MTTTRPRDAMMQPVQNPELMYRSDPLPAPMRLRLRALNYAHHVTEQLCCLNWLHGRLKAGVA